MTDLLTFRSSLRFWEVPQKGVYFFFTCLVGYVKTFSIVLGVGMNVGPYMAYILHI